jgi:integrase
VPYQYVKEPLTTDESDRLSSACETTTERLDVCTVLDTGLRVGELCGLTPRNIFGHERQRRIKCKAGSRGKQAKVRVVPLSPRVRTHLEH